ncbi:MAG: superoxide dismutase family protein [Blastocatellales bacterium]
MALKKNSLMLTFAVVASALVLWAGLRAAAHNNPSPQSEAAKAVAVLHPTDGNKVHGTVTFAKAGDKVKVTAHIEGLTPGKHGFHIHEWGDCSSKDGSAAGGHFNPAMAPHGAPDAAKRHAGDLGNIEANQDGVAHVEFTDPVMTLGGPKSIIGRGVIVHAKADDLKTQPTGDAGGRLACGVIGIAKP